MCGKAFVTACGGARLPGAFVGFPWYRGPPRRRRADQVLEAQGARDREVQCQQPVGAPGRGGGRGYGAHGRRVESQGGIHMLHPLALREVWGASGLEGIRKTTPAVPIADSEPVRPQIERPLWIEKTDVGASKLAGDVPLDMCSALVAHTGALTVG